MPIISTKVMDFLFIHAGCQNIAPNVGATRVLLEVHEAYNQLSGVGKFRKKWAAQQLTKQSAAQRREPND